MITTFKARQHKKQVQQTRSLYTRMDNRIIPEGKDEVRLFAVARNESLRLPYFLHYYFQLGIDRIFLIDNNSTDDTKEIALSYDNVHVFTIEQNYKHYWNWMEFFLETYGTGHWCMVVDIDELLSYPSSEIVSLKRLLSYMETNHFTALRCLLLDMYSDRPVKDTYCKPGENPLKVCSFFDTNYLRLKSTSFDKKRWKPFESISHYGGMRQRIFGNVNGRPWFFCLSKIPVFKYSEEIYLTEGMHAINGARIADIEGVVFHTKFLSDFIEEAQVESAREQHFHDGAEYKRYHFYLTHNPDLILMNRRSEKLQDLEQLVRLGIMKTSENYCSWTSGTKEEMPQ